MFRTCFIVSLFFVSSSFGISEKELTRVLQAIRIVESNNTLPLLATVVTLSAYIKSGRVTGKMQQNFLIWVGSIVIVLFLNMLIELFVVT